MSNSKVIVILSMLATLLLPAVLIADELPSGKPAAVSAAPNKTLPGPEAVKTAEGPAPSEFIHSFDTTILPDGDAPAEADNSGQYIEIPASALDRVMLTPENTVSEDVKGPIEKNIRMFTSGLKERFSTWLARSGKYLGMMKSIFRENYMPEELVFLSLIESGFNPKAYSWANASGPWQFIKGTGKRYGLRIDPWVDERRDPVKSTRAAAAYLKDLYDMFGTWSLAMASYNAGEGNVARAVNRGGTLDFWELRKARTLPQETKEYVPKFIAAKMIAQNPKLFGFDGLEYEQPFEFDEVVVNKSVSLKSVAKCCGVSVDEVKDLNPELIRMRTPPNNPGYTLRIPKGTKDTFQASFDGAAQDPPEEFYVVRRGDTLKKIAKKFGTNVADIRDLNGITKLHVGQRLDIPVPDNSPKTEVAANTETSEPPATQATSATQATADAPQTEGATGKHTVKKGDTLFRIAKQYNMTPAELAGLNGITAEAKVKAGQVLVVSADAPDSQKPVEVVASNDETPAPAKAKTHHYEKKTYKVKRGDTVWTIAQRFGVTVERLMKSNSMSRRARIRVGQRLVIPVEEAA